MGISEKRNKMKMVWSIQHYFKFVLAILAAILDLWTSFAIETYPLIFPWWLNVCRQEVHFFRELKNGVMVNLIICMFVVATLQPSWICKHRLSLRYHLSYCMEDKTCIQVHTKTHFYVNKIIKLWPFRYFPCPWWPSWQPYWISIHLMPSRYIP